MWIICIVYVVGQREKKYVKYLEYSESLHQLDIGRDSGCSGENHYSAVGSHKDQFSNLKATLLSQGGSELYI